MQSGYYILTTNVISGQNYLLLTGYASSGLHIEDWIAAHDLSYSLCLSGGVWVACPWVDAITKEGRYFREIRWYGLFSKDTTITWWQYINCTSGVDYTTCSSYAAKEFRFCSKVTYVGYGTWEVELCGLLTNFKEK